MTTFGGSTTTGFSYTGSGFSGEFFSLSKTNLIGGFTCFALADVFVDGLEVLDVGDMLVLVLVCLFENRFANLFWDFDFKEGHGSV